MFPTLTFGWLSSVERSLEDYAISKNDEVLFVPRLRLIIGHYFTPQICILIQYGTLSQKMRWKLLPTMPMNTVCHCSHHHYDTRMPRQVAAKIVNNAVANSQLSNASI
jgi:hypothetical protein